MDSNNKPKSRWVKAEFIDGTVFIAVMILSALGVLMVFSITGTSIFNNQSGDRLSYMMHSLTGVVVGVLILGIMAVLPNKWFRKHVGMLIFIATTIIFLITPIFGQDTQASPDVRRWLKIGPITFQAVDLARVGFVISLAWLIDLLIEKRLYYSKKIWSTWLIPLLYVGICAFTVMRQPDLGSTLVIFGTGMIVFLSSGLAVKQIMLLFMVAIGAFVVVLFFGIYVFDLQYYQIDRLTVWIDPFNHDNGLQTVMGFISIALGGWFGVGLGQSRQALGFAIEPHTDLIVTILAEELGFVTVLAVMILYFTIAIKCFLTSLKSRDVFSALVCIGVGSFFLLQPLVNLGGASGIIPLSGVTLPLISYGMTSKISTFMMIGIYFNMRRHILLTQDAAVLEAQVSQTALEKKVVQLPQVVK